MNTCFFPAVLGVLIHKFILNTDTYKRYHFASLSMVVYYDVDT